MASLKNRSARGYLLLESLIALALLAFLVGGILSALTESNLRTKALNSQVEAYNVAQMAVQTGQNQLALNDAAVEISQTQDSLVIKNHGKEILQLHETN